MTQMLDAPAKQGTESVHLVVVKSKPASMTVTWDLPSATGAVWGDGRHLLLRQLLASEAKERSSSRRLIDLLRGQPAARGMNAVRRAEPSAVITAREVLNSFPDGPDGSRSIKLFPTEAGGVRLQRSAAGVTRSVEIEPDRTFTARTASVRPLGVEEHQLNTQAEIVRFLR